MNIFATTFSLMAWSNCPFGFGQGTLRDQIFDRSTCRVCQLLVVVGCLWSYFQRRAKQRSDILRFLVTFVLTTGFFALDMAIFQPRYLGIFPRLLHPRLP